MSKTSLRTEVQRQAGLMLRGEPDTMPEFHSVVTKASRQMEKYLVHDAMAQKMTAIEPFLGDLQSREDQRAVMRLVIELEKLSERALSSADRIRRGVTGTLEEDVA